MLLTGIVVNSTPPIPLGGTGSAVVISQVMAEVTTKEKEGLEVLHPPAVASEVTALPASSCPPQHSYCPNCGAVIGGACKFCSSCGK